MAGARRRSKWKTRAVVGAIEDLAPLIVGRDPRDIEQAVRAMKKQSFWRLGAVGDERDLGDRDRALGHPRQGARGAGLAPPRRQGARQGRRLHPSRPRRHARRLRDAGGSIRWSSAPAPVVEGGYRAFKAVFIPYTHFHAPLPEIDKVARLMDALRVRRRAGGRDHGRLPRPPGLGRPRRSPMSTRSRRAGRCSSRNRCRPVMTAGLAAIAARTSVPIATGERAGRAHRSPRPGHQAGR